MKSRIAIAIASLFSASLLTPAISEACSRAVYFGKEGQTVTGRTMDWFVSDMDTNMWLYPRGLERTSSTRTPLNWKSKYGSVVTTIYEGAAADPSVVWADFRKLDFSEGSGAHRCHRVS